MGVLGGASRQNKRFTVTESCLQVPATCGEPGEVRDRPGTENTEYRLYMQKRMDFDNAILSTFRNDRTPRVR